MLYIVKKKSSKYYFFQCIIVTCFGFKHTIGTKIVKNGLLKQTVKSLYTINV